MTEAANYEQTAAAVDLVDASYHEGLATLDMSEVFLDVLEIKKLKYSDVGMLVEGSEIKKAEAVQEVQSQPQQQQQTQQPKVQMQVQVPRHALEDDMKQAANKLMGMAGGVGKEFEEMIEKDIEEARESKLIMPKLSLQDQVSDLEKVQEGITEGSFGKEQVNIITKEIKALDRIASREDISKLSDDQKELAAMRNQKVKEIKSGLNIK